MSENGRYGTGLLERNWSERALGAIPGVPVWAPEADGPILPDWETLIAGCPKEYEDDASYGLFDLNQGSDPSCTWFSTGNAMQWHLARNGRAVPHLDCRAAWIETTGGRGGEELATAAQWAMTKGVPIVGGGRLKAKGWWDIPDAAALFSAIALGRSVLMGWMHPAGAHAQCGLYIPEPKTLGIRGSWGKNYAGETWRNVPYASLVRGIATFGAFALLDVEVLDAKEDASA